LPLKSRSRRVVTEREATHLEQVLLPNLDAAYNLARWLLRDAAEAEEVVQNAMLRAINYFASFRGGDARAWLLKIVRRAAYDTLAQRGKFAEVGLDEEEMDLPDPADDPETALQSREQRLALDDAMASLPPPLRECLVLHELEELSYKEIAQVTGVPIGTVMSRLWRARQLLLKALASSGEPQS
jgi:RNA polymerase sigma-70 factor, ECF subfamily